MGRDDVGQGRFHLGFIADVAHPGFEGETFLVAALHHLLESFRNHVRADHVRPFAGQAFGRGTPDSRGGTGNQGDPAFESLQRGGRFGHGGTP